MLLVVYPVFSQTLMRDGTIDSTAMHYWDRFDFVNQTTGTIQPNFTRYLRILRQADPATAEKSISILLNKAERSDSVAFRAIADLFELYLYNPNSPVRNEELYIPVLKYLCVSQAVDFAGKTRAEFRLKRALKNRVGEPAADFEYILPKGEKGKLNDIKADYLLIFFNNPDCPDCKRVKAILSSANLSGIKILALYPDKDLSAWEKTVYPDTWINAYNNTTINDLYDLKAIPTLYLLDKNKRVLLKDPDVENILEYVRSL